MAVFNTKTKLPQDEDSVPIQVLAPDESSVASFTLAGTTNVTALPVLSQIVEVAVTGNCRFVFGTSGVSAATGTRRILLPGVYVYKVPSGATHFDAVTFGGSSGSISVVRMF